MKKILILQTRPGIGDLCIFLSAMHEIAKKILKMKLLLLPLQEQRRMRY